MDKNKALFLQALMNASGKMPENGDNKKGKKLPPKKKGK